MVEVAVKNILNEAKGTMALNEAIFGLPVSIPVLYEVEQMQRASVRQGTANTKERGFVRGGGKKPWRQKGTGRARAGSTRSPLWKGGGTTFGPHSRSYAYSVPKKKARLALCMALSSIVQEKRLVVLEEMTLGEVKTRSMVYLLNKIEVQGKVLILVVQKTDELDRASRNIPYVHILEMRRVNVSDLLRADVVLTTQRDLERFSEMWRE